MANVWRIHLLESPNYGEYCLKNNVAAVGWNLDKYNDDIKAGKIKIESYSDYAKYAEKCWDNFHDVRRLAEEIKPGDFIWTRVDGKYYLAKVSAASHYRYNSSDEAVEYRACNELTDIYWKLVGESKDIDEKIRDRMERGQTLCKMFAEDNADFKFGLKYSQKIYDKLEGVKIMKRTALYGAILGDIIGVPYEFDMNRPATKDFPLFREECDASDDTVTTIAIAEAVLKAGRVLKTKIANEPDTDGREFRYAIQNSLLTWCRKYRAGYGSRFRKWIQEKHPEPYNSYGNGAAMRVSAAGWYYDTLYETREAARATARVTHNHFEGMKGAMATACAIFLARTGATKEEIKNYIEREFDYNLSRTIEEMRPTYRHVESCQETVPQAIIAFLESDSYESAIRNCIWLGGDVDTLGAICGAIAEAFYGIPENLIVECRKYLPKDMLAVVDKFNYKIFGAKKN